MTKFDKTSWAEPDYAEEYIMAADIIIVDREKMLDILASFYDYHLLNSGNKSIMDMGCGDGILSHRLLKADPSLNITLIDASDTMLEKARHRLKQFKSLTFLTADLSRLSDETVKFPSFDMIVSAFAIHHIPLPAKGDLFSFIYSHLNDGGYFVNLDTVLPPSGDLEGWYLQLWRDWILARSGKDGYSVNPDRFIGKYLDDSHHECLDSLDAQLDSLFESGFKNVDCYYKQGTFAMYGGKK